MARHPTPDLRLCASPSPEQITTLWRALGDDPRARHAYSDRLPRTVAGAHDAIASGRLDVRVVLQAETVIGMLYVHDRGTAADGTPYGWIGTYMVSGHRGKTAVHAFRLLRQTLAAEGLTRLYVAVRASNVPGMVHAAACGFERASLFPAFARFRGTLDSVILYALSEEGRRDIWKAAQRLAATSALALLLLSGCARGPVPTDDTPVQLEVQLEADPSGGTRIHTTCSGGTPANNRRVCDEFREAYDRQSAGTPLHPDWRTPPAERTQP
jgi:RimJ/RimL family protein N-acetyltransferase